MRVELEFGLKFIVDPTQPILKDEVECLDRAYALFRGMQLRNGVEPKALESAERGVLSIKRAAARQAVNEYGGDRTKAAAALGIARTTLYHWLGDASIAPPTPPTRGRRNGHRRPIDPEPPAPRSFVKVTTTTEN